MTTILLPLLLKLLLSLLQLAKKLYDGSISLRSFLSLKKKKQKKK